MRINHYPLLLLPAIIAIFAIASQPRDANAYSDNASTSATSTSSSDILMCSLNISENEEEEKIIMALCQQEHLDQYNGHDGHDDDDDDGHDQDDEEYKYDHVGAIGLEKRSHRRYYNMKKNEILLDKDENLSQLPHPKAMCSPSSNIKKMHDGNKDSTTVKKKKKIKVKKRIRQGFHAKENELSVTHQDSDLMIQQEETNPESHASFLSKNGGGGGGGGGGAWNQPQVRQDLQKHEVESISARQNQRQHPQQQQKADLLPQYDTHVATSTMAVASSKNSHHPLRLHTTRTGTNLIIPAAFVKSNEQKNLQQKENQEKKENQEWEKQEWEKLPPQQQQQLQYQHQHQQSQQHLQRLPKQSIEVKQRQPKQQSTLISTTAMSLTTPWARKFISSRPKDALLPIPREFLSDGFNLVHVAPIVERAVEAMRLQPKEIIQPQLQSHAPLQSNPTGTDPGQEKNGFIYNSDNCEFMSTVPSTVSNPSSTTTDSSLHHMSLYKAALRLILEENEVSGNPMSGENYQAIVHSHAKYSPHEIQNAAEVLYVLVHARYASSPRGLDTIKRMFQNNISNRGKEARSMDDDWMDGTIEPIFGRCTRIACNGMPLLPIGMSDCYDIGGKGGMGRRAMRYCPCCREIFYLWESKVDGAAWGTSFAHLFLMVQGSEVFGSHLVRARRERNSKIHHDERTIQQTRPTIFGFPLHPSVY